MSTWKLELEPQDFNIWNDWNSTLYKLTKVKNVKKDYKYLERWYDIDNGTDLYLLVVQAGHHAWRGVHLLSSQRVVPELIVTTDFCSESAILLKMIIVSSNKVTF